MVWSDEVGNVNLLGFGIEVWIADFTVMREASFSARVVERQLFPPSRNQRWISNASTSIVSDRRSTRSKLIFVLNMKRQGVVYTMCLVPKAIYRFLQNALVKNWAAASRNVPTVRTHPYHIKGGRLFPIMEFYPPPGQRKNPCSVRPEFYFVATGLNSPVATFDTGLFTDIAMEIGVVRSLSGSLWELYRPI